MRCSRKYRRPTRSASRRRPSTRRKKYADPLEASPPRTRTLSGRAPRACGAPGPAPARNSLTVTISPTGRGARETTSFRQRSDPVPTLPPNLAAPRAPPVADVPPGCPHTLRTVACWQKTLRPGRAAPLASVATLPRLAPLRGRGYAIIVASNQSASQARSAVPIALATHPPPSQFKRQPRARAGSVCFVA